MDNYETQSLLRQANETLGHINGVLDHFLTEERSFGRNPIEQRYKDGKLILADLLFTKATTLSTIATLRGQLTTNNVFDIDIPDEEKGA